MNTSTPVLVALALVGTLTGFVNTLAGGGTLVSVPALMLAGLPVDVANTTSRPAVLAQSVTGAVGLTRSLPRRDALAGVHLRRVLPPTVGGGLLGAWLATAVPRDALRPLTLVTMMGVAVLLATRRPPSARGGAGAPAHRPRGWSHGWPSRWPEHAVASVREAWASSCWRRRLTCSTTTS